jgi:hypothetical protein
MAPRRMDTLTTTLETQLSATLPGWPPAVLPSTGLVAVVGSANPPAWQACWPQAVCSSLSPGTLAHHRLTYDVVVWLNPDLTDLELIPPLLKPRGVALLAVPRPWPLGVPGSPWAGGLSLKNWQAELKLYTLKLTTHTPVGGPAGCARWLAVGRGGRGGKALLNNDNAHSPLRPVLFPV